MPSIPINVIIIISLAVVVLLAIGSFFLTNYNDSSNSISNQQAMLDGCGQWRERYFCQMTDDSPQFSSMKIDGYNVNSNRALTDKSTFREACIQVLFAGIEPDIPVLREQCHNYCCG